MTRNVFYSFHYDVDSWRASQVRNAGVIDGSRPCSDNDWETITRSGDAAIRRWIDGQISGRSCAVVLIGESTARRKWVNYEIEKAWNDGKGVVGVYVHNLLDANGRPSPKGSNPFDEFTLGSAAKKLSAIAKAYDPPFSTSTHVYQHIKSHLAEWVEEAIQIRDS